MSTASPPSPTCCPPGASTRHSPTSPSPRRSVTQPRCLLACLVDPFFVSSVITVVGWLVIDFGGGSCLVCLFAPPFPHAGQSARQSSSPVVVAVCLLGRSTFFWSCVCQFPAPIIHPFTPLIPPPPSTPDPLQVLQARAHHAHGEDADQQELPHLRVPHRPRHRPRKHPFHDGHGESGLGRRLLWAGPSLGLLGGLG